MLWSSTDSEKAMCALEHMIAMIKSMHMELICEGVETQSQATMLEHMGCDYFQAVFDPANFVQCGQDTVKAYEMLKDHIAYLHIKKLAERFKVFP